MEPISPKISAFQGVQQMNIPLAAGPRHSVGLRSDGTVMAVGDVRNGQCDVSDWRGIRPTATTVCGRPMRSQQYTGKSHTGASVGRYGGCHGMEWASAMRSERMERSRKWRRTLGLRGDGWRDIVAIAAGDWHTAGLSADGTVIMAGNNRYGQCHVSQWHNIKSVAAGYLHTAGLRSDGTVVATGANKHHQCEVGDWRGIMAVAAGSYHTVGLKSDGTVVAAGSNQYGQCEVSNWREIVAIAAGCAHTLGLKADGSVVATGHNEYGQCEVSKWRGINLLL